MEIIPWHTLCIDLIGPYKIGNAKKKNETILHCLTMIDPATGWFEIAEVPSARADDVINILEINWLTRYPWPTEVIMDRGKEFAAEVKQTLKEEYGVNRKVITTRNPQANSVVERVHQTIHRMISSAEIHGKSDLDPHYGWSGILAAVRRAVNATVHTTTLATPSQLVFGRDAILNIGFQIDWELVKDRKQRLIQHNNQRENLKRVPHNYNVGDKVMVKQAANRKHGSHKYLGPYTITFVNNDKGTVKLLKATTAGGVQETWNIRNLDPCMA